MLLVTKKNNTSDNYWIGHTYRVINMIERINTVVAETGSIKAEYAAGNKTDAVSRAILNRKTLMAYVDSLYALTTGNPSRQRHIRQLICRIDSLPSIGSNLFYPGEGKGMEGKAMDFRPDPSIAAILHTIKEQESELLAERQSRANQDTRTAVRLLTGAGMLTFSLIVLLLNMLNRDIMLRKLSEITLRQSELKYRNLVENASAVIYSADLQGTINFASDKAIELTGYSTRELNGMHFSTLVAPAGLNRVVKHYEEQVRSGTVETSLEFPIVTKDGGTKWVEQSVVLLTDKSGAVSFQCIVKDISDKKLMRQDLEASEFKLKENQIWLQSILDNTTSLIFIKDLGGRYMLINRRFRELLNVREEDVINKTDYDFSTPELADHYKKLDEEVIRTRKPVEIGKWIDTREGKKNLLLIKFPLLDEEGTIFGISGIATDITERANYQQELILATKDAEDSKKMQEQFLANMSHEIRTPMNGIQGMTNLLLETPLNGQQREFANIIRSSSNNLLVIINDILDFSRIKAGKMALEKIDFSFNDVLDNVKVMFGQRVREKGLDLLVETDPLVPDLLRGDPYRLNQVLVNLVGNAIKFTEKGHILIKVRQKASTTTGTTICISVSDTGIGISQENLPCIFDSFSQAGVDIARRYGGTGLGLAISRQLVNLQGGHISVVSEPGRGSSFTFEIQYGLCDNTLRLQKIVTSINDHAGLLNGRRFLVAEDNEVNQKLIEHVLRKAGGVVRIAANGQEALDELRQYPGFDVIIMDLQMPVMDGYAASRFIRREMKLDTPIIAMTATALTGEQERCMEAGMNEYMTKPFEFTDLYRCIAGLLDNGHTKPLIPGKTAVPAKTAALYDLSLLEELNDNEYLKDILDTFLENMPLQLNEIRQASVQHDYEKIYYLSHKLKGSVGMFRSVALQDLFSKIEQQSRERMDTSGMIQSTINIYYQLEDMLKIERSKVEYILRHSA